MAQILHVCVASRTGHMDIRTEKVLDQTAIVMGKYGNQAAIHCISGNWLAYARRHAVLQAYQLENNSLELRGLIIDDDIKILNTPQELAHIFQTADEQNLNITANYKAANGANLVFNGERRYKDAELLALDKSENEFTDLTGLIGTMGFYYGVLPKDYIWHQDSLTDEGTNFFRDNPQLNVKLANHIRLSHRVSNDLNLEHTFLEENIIEK